MKCFLVDCGDGDRVYFASTRGQAKIQAANEEDTDITGVESCRRKPEWDEYAPGPVPVKVLLAEGWWFECSGCGQRVYEEDGQIVTETAVWCSPECKNRVAIRDAKYKLDEQARIIEAVRAIEVHFPGAAFYSIGYGMTRSILFHIPGAREHIQWTLGSQYVCVAPIDIPAWEEFQRQTDLSLRSWEDDGGASAA